MDFITEDIDLIEKYLAKNLTEKEKQSFENKLQEDPAFQQTVKDYIAVRTAINLGGQERLRAYLNSQPLPPRKTFLVRPLYLKIAAAVVILFLFVFAISRFMNPPDNTETLMLAVKHELSEKPSVPASRGEGNTTLEVKSLVYEADKAFETGKYETSFSLWGQYLQQDSTLKNDACFFMGMSKLLNHQNAEAREYLSKVPSSSQDHFRAQWFIALSFLEEKNIKEARPILESLSVNSRTYRERANNLLRYI